MAPVSGRPAQQWQPQPGYQPAAGYGQPPATQWPQQPAHPQQPVGYPPPQQQPVHPYQQPGYQQPGYQPPQWQQAQPSQPPQWQQPGQPPQWQQPAPPGRPPTGSRRGLWIALAAGAAVVVLLAGCGIAFAVWRSGPDPVAAPPTPVVSDTFPENLPTRPARPESEVKLVRPDRIGDRDRITEGEYATKAANAEKELKSTLDPGGSLVVGYYGTTDRKDNQIYIVGTTIPGPMKRSTFDKEFTETGPAIDGKPVTRIATVPAGAAGGFIKCGQTTQKGLTVALCAFSNQYDFVVVQWYNRELSEDIKQEIREIRALVEQ